MNKDHIIRIAIESLPATDPAWFEIMTALIAPAIAIVAVYIAFQQHRINEQRLRHETYERRLKVYKAVQKHLSLILRDGKTTYPLCTEFYTEASEAAFLFDKIERLFLLFCSATAPALLCIHAVVNQNERSRTKSGRQTGKLFRAHSLYE